MHTFGNKIFYSGMHILHFICSVSDLQLLTEKSVYSVVRCSRLVRHIGTDGGGDPKCFNLEEASALSWVRLEDPSPTKPLKPHCPSASSGWENPELLGKPSWLFNWQMSALVMLHKFLGCCHSQLPSPTVINGGGHLDPPPSIISSYLSGSQFSLRVTSLPLVELPVAWWITNH